MANRIEGDALTETIDSSSAPTAPQRAQLADRSAELHRSLNPAGREYAEDEIAVLLDVLARQTGSEQRDEELLLAYSGDLADLPKFALSAACRAFRTGVRGDGRFLPKIAEIRSVALEYARPISEESHKISRVLTARVSPARDRASGERVREIADETIRDIQARSGVFDAAKRRKNWLEPPNVAPTPDEALGALKQRFAANPTTLGDEALRAVGATPPRHREDAA